MAQAGVTAKRGDPVKGEILVPKVNQCAGVLTSFLGKLTGSALHTDQYAEAACASIIRIAGMFSAAGNSATNCSIACSPDCTPSFYLARFISTPT